MSSHSRTSQMSKDSDIGRAESQSRNKIDTLIVLDTLVAEKSELGDISINNSIRKRTFYGQ